MSIGYSRVMPSPQLPTPGRHVPAAPDGLAAVAKPSAQTEEQPPQDGRTARWEAHNVRRRAELVEHALTAIRQFGPSVGMDEIAQVAGTSKPVLYRHLGDRAGLHRAVTAVVGERLQARISAAITGPDPDQRPTPRRAVAAVLDSYLSLVERDPQVYRFVGTGATGTGADDDPVRHLTRQVARQLTGYLAEAGVPQSFSDVWGPALAGLARAAADDWMAADNRIPRADLVEQLTMLTWRGLRDAPTSMAENLPTAPAP